MRLSAAGRIRLAEKDRTIAREFAAMYAAGERNIADRLAAKYGYSHRKDIYCAIRRDRAQQRSEQPQQ